MLADLTAAEMVRLRTDRDFMVKALCVLGSVPADDACVVQVAWPRRVEFRIERKSDVARWVLADKLARVVKEYAAAQTPADKAYCRRELLKAAKELP